MRKAKNTGRSEGPKNKGSEAPDERKDRDKMKWILLLLVLLIFVFFCVREMRTHALLSRSIDINENLDAQGIVSSDETNAEIIDELNKRVEDTRLSVCINSAPTFDDGDSKGYLNIRNQGANKHPIVVEIYLEDGRLVYSSGSIAVGKAVYSAKLSERLSKGHYPATAYFYLVDEDTGEILAGAGVNITITVNH